MCFSEEISWATFATNLVGCWLLWTSKGALAGGSRGASRALAVFLAFVGVMQAHEALLWRDVDANAGACTDANVRITRLAALTNHAQPLVLLACCWAFAPEGAAPPPAFVLLTAAAYAVVAVVVTRRFLVTRRCTRLTRHGLVWPWNDVHSVTYVLFLASFTVTMVAYVPDARVLALMWGSFLGSWLLYSDRKMAGSMWCFAAALAPLVLAVMG
jgi:hypothetical protein